jgi:Methyltransferase domain
VFAGDICLNSLRLAKTFADHNTIRNVAFLQMNLFRPPFRDGVFDIVISNGVLHHTGDCEGGFRSILSKLKAPQWALQFLCPIAHALEELGIPYVRIQAAFSRSSPARLKRQP